MRVFSENCKIVLAKAAQTAATDAVESDIIDMAGFEGVLFLTRFATANAGNYIKAQQDSDSAGGSMADLEGTKVASGTSDEAVYLDINRPLKRYLRLHVTRTESSALGEIWAILYGPKKAPQTHAVAGTLTGEAHVSPAEGTA